MSLHFIYMQNIFTISFVFISSSDIIYLVFFCEFFSFISVVSIVNATYLNPVCFCFFFSSIAFNFNAERRDDGSFPVAQLGRGRSETGKKKNRKICIQKHKNLCSPKLLFRPSPFPLFCSPCPCWLFSVAARRRFFAQSSAHKLLGFVCNLLV